MDLDQKIANLTELYIEFEREVAQYKKNAVT